MTGIHRPLQRIGPRELDGLLRGWREAGAAGPAYLALAERLRSLVLDGRLPVQTVLPSERALAEVAGTSRTTTTAAYKVMRESGFAAGHHGAGTWTTLPGSGALQPWPVHHGDGVPGPVPDLTTASFEAPPELHAAYSAALSELPRYLPGHGYLTAGVPALRSAVARRYTERGLATEPEQVLITAGASQGLRLVLDALVGRGDRVLVEHPSWPLAVDAVRRSGGRPVAFPVEQGWDPEVLRSLLTRTRPALAYLIPDFHNPTGRLLAGSSRRAVARLLTEAGVISIVDESTAELDLRAELGLPAPEGLPAPWPTLTPPGSSVCVGSASKIFWGGLRIGWVRAEPGLIRQLTQLKAGYDLAGPVLEQLTTAHLLQRSARWLPRRRAEVAERCRCLRQSLSEELPNWEAPAPDGGVALWVRLPAPRSSSLAVAARTLGLGVTPGPRFGVDGGFETRLRLPFTAHPSGLREAVRLLARAWTEQGPHGEEAESALVV